MKMAIKVVVVLAIYLPYRLSDFSKDASFMLDFLVAFGAFAIAAGIIYLIDQGKKTDTPDGTDQ